MPKGLCGYLLKSELLKTLTDNDHPFHYGEDNQLKKILVLVTKYSLF